MDADAGVFSRPEIGVAVLAEASLELAWHAEARLHGELSGFVNVSVRRFFVCGERLLCTYKEFSYLIEGCSLLFVFVLLWHFCFYCARFYKYFFLRRYGWD